MIRIEFEKPIKEICSCCNNEIVKLTRFVYKDEDAFAIYYLKFTKGHEDKHALGIISIGDWDTDEPKNRFAFPFRIWTNEDNFQVGLMDKEDSHWKQDLLGNILDRKEALEHPLIQEVFHITDHIVEEDEVLIEYFN
ncbi:MAG: hypothetical protein ABWY22_05440 [Flavobacterium sp.]